MKSKISFIITALSAAVLLSMGLLLIVLGEKEPRASLSENRMLQGMPEFSTENIFSGNMGGEFEDYLLDGFLLRNIVIDFSESCLSIFSAQTEEDIQLLKGGDDEIQGLVNAPGVPESFEDDFYSEDPQQENLSQNIDDGLSSGDTSTYPSEDIVDENTVKYGFYYKKQDGKLQRMFFTDPTNIEQTAHALNAYKAELPEDGNVFYMMVPLHDNYKPVRNNKENVGWYSNTEDGILEHTVDGVHVINVPEVLSPHIDEEIYFPLDHHWSALGAWYVAEELMNIQGLPMTPYNEYDYLKVNNGGRWFDVLYPLQDVAASKVYNRTNEQPDRFMNYNTNTYMAYLTGIIRPWTKLETGFSTGRKALIIGGSFANVFAPYLVPYYDEVHMTDIRVAYYDSRKSGGSISELIEYHGIDDVYMVMSYASAAHTATSYERLEMCLYG